MWFILCGRTSTTCVWLAVTVVAVLLTRLAGSMTVENNVGILRADATANEASLQKQLEDTKRAKESGPGGEVGVSEAEIRMAIDSHPELKQYTHDADFIQKVNKLQTTSHMAMEEDVLADEMIRQLFETTACAGTAGADDNKDETEANFGVEIDEVDGIAEDKGQDDHQSGLQKFVAECCDCCRARESMQRYDFQCLSLSIYGCSNRKHQLRCKWSSCKDSFSYVSPVASRVSSSNGVEDKYSTFLKLCFGCVLGQFCLLFLLTVVVFFWRSLVWLFFGLFS